MSLRLLILEVYWQSQKNSAFQPPALLGYTANYKQCLQKDASMWKGFSLSSKPLIHNSLFRSENWTAKCYWRIFYIKIITGEKHSDLKAKQKNTKLLHSVMLHLWDAGRRHPKIHNPWTDIVGIFGFWPILGAWVGSGRLCSHVGPGTPNTPRHFSSATLARNARARHTESCTMDSELAATEVYLFVQKKWCSGHGCSEQADAEE